MYATETNEYDEFVGLIVDAGVGAIGAVSDIFKGKKKRKAEAKKKAEAQKKAIAQAQKEFVDLKAKGKKTTMLYIGAGAGVLVLVVILYFVLKK